MLYLPESEKIALYSVDGHEHWKAIANAVDHQDMRYLSHLSLDRCGPAVAGRRDELAISIAKLRESQSSLTRRRRRVDVDRAARALSFVLNALIERARKEDEDRKLFVVNHLVDPPLALREEMSVWVSFSWRRSEEDQWSYGHIVFKHRYRPRISVDDAKRARKRSAAQREDDLEAALEREWTYLRDGALYAVRDYLRQGGDGQKIPEEFKVVTDRYTGALDNFSCKFWTGGD